MHHREGIETEVLVLEKISVDLDYASLPCSYLNSSYACTVASFDKLCSKACPLKATHTSSSAHLSLTKYKRKGIKGETQSTTMATPNPYDYEAIRNTIALYCIALDTKDFDLLDQVFTADVETVYPFGGKRTGVKDIKDAINKRSIEQYTHRIHSTAY